MFFGLTMLKDFPNNKQNNYFLCSSDTLMSQQGTCTVQVVKR